MLIAVCACESVICKLSSCCFFSSFAFERFALRRASRISMLSQTIKHMPNTFNDRKTDMSQRPVMRKIIYDMR